MKQTRNIKDNRTKKAAGRALKALTGITAAVLLTGLPVSAQVQMMQDGALFDADWYAQTYPAAAAEVGTDPAALYQNYRSVHNAQVSDALKGIGTDPAVLSYEIPEAEKNAAGDYLTRTPGGVQPIATSLVYTLANTLIHTEPTESSSVLGSYGVNTALKIDGYVYDYDADGNYEWLEVVRRDGSKAYVRRGFVSPVSPQSTTATSLNESAADLAPVLGGSLDSLTGTLSAIGYAKTAKSASADGTEQFVTFTKGEQSVTASLDSTGLVTGISADSADVRIGSLYVGQGYVDLYQHLSVYGGRITPDLSPASLLFYPAAGDTVPESFTGRWCTLTFRSGSDSTGSFTKAIVSFDADHNVSRIEVQD